MSKLEKLYQRMLNGKGLPAAEGIVNEILVALDNEKTNNEQLVKLITSDVALTQKVLKLVNSPMYNSYTREISTVTEALRILGIKAIVHIVLGAILVSKVEIDKDEELSKTMLATELVKCIGSTGEYEDAAIVTMLYNVGKLLASKYLKEEMDQIQDLMLKGESAEDAEMKVLNLTLQQLGVAIAKTWQLPTAITSVLDNSGDKELIKIARFSNTASSLIFEGRSHEVKELASALNLSEDSLLRLTSLVKEKAASIIVKIKDDALKVNLDTIQLVPEIKVDLTPIIPESVSDERINPNDALEKLLEIIRMKKYENLEVLTNFVLLFVKTRLNAAHCFYFAKRNFYNYSIEYGVSDNWETVLKTFTINLRDSMNVFQSAISNVVDVNIQDIAKLSATSVPAYYKTLLPNVKRFLILPLSNKSGIAGVLYFDWENNDSTNVEELSILKKIRDEFIPYTE